MSWSVSWWARGQYHSARRGGVPRCCCADGKAGGKRQKGKARGRQGGLWRRRAPGISQHRQASKTPNGKTENGKIKADTRRRNPGIRLHIFSSPPPHSLIPKPVEGYTVSRHDLMLATAISSSCLGITAYSLQPHSRTAYFSSLVPPRLCGRECVRVRQPRMAARRWVRKAAARMARSASQSVRVSHSGME